MCGGLACSASNDRKSWLIYQTGRLLGYLGLGFMAGTLGKHILLDTWTSPMVGLTALAMSLGLIASGISLWPGSHALFSTPKFVVRAFPKFMGKLQNILKNAPTLRSFSFGIFTVLLPCGWLYSFVMLAVATKSPISGAAVLVSLWLGSLPALTIGPVVFQFFKLRAPRFQQMALALALIVLGGMNLFQKVSQSSRLVSSMNSRPDLPAAILSCGTVGHHP